MTEMVRVLADNFEPRQVGTRAFGRAVPGVDVRVVDDETVMLGWVKSGHAIHVGHGASISEKLTEPLQHQSPRPLARSGHPTSLAA
jgi:hypothetical protein